MTKEQECEPQDTDPVPRSEYGKQWVERATLITKFGENIERSAASEPEDIAVAEAIYRLMRQVNEDDRAAYFQQDLRALSLDLSGGSSAILTAIHKMQQAYSMTDEERMEELNKLQMGTFIPEPQWEKNGELYHFSKVTLEPEAEGAISVAMQPVYDGGIDSVAYPVRSIGVITAPDKPIVVDFSRISFMRKHPLEDELQRHPLVIKELKQQFAKVTDRYTGDRNGFLHDRAEDGSGDRTQLEGYLFDYLGSTYFKQLKKGYRPFEQGVLRLQRNYKSNMGHMNEELEGQFYAEYLTLFHRGLETIRGNFPTGPNIITDTRKRK